TRSTSTSRTASGCSGSATASKRTTTSRTSTPTTTSRKPRWLNARRIRLRLNGSLFLRSLLDSIGRSMPTTPFVKSERLQKLPPYLFAEIDKKKKAALAAGRDVINLGVGDPDRPTPPTIIQSLQHHVENSAFHQYALDQGAPELRQSIATFCKRRYGLDLDP